MKESEIVKKFLDTKELACGYGLTLKAELDKFVIVDAPKAIGIIAFKTIDEVATFVYGYGHGYDSGK